MKKILSVSIDTVTLNIFSSLLSEHTSDFEIITAESIKESVAILKKIKIDIVVIDLDHPTLKELEVVKQLSSTNSKISFAVLSAFETGEIKSTIKSMTAVQCFEKPVDFKELADKIFENMGGGVGGEIHGISLASFLQMSEMERTSCTLKVKVSDEKVGRLYLIKGALVAAETGNNKNEEAAYEILAWDNPVIEIEDADPNVKKEIQTPLMNLLMEGVRRKDEKAAGAKKGKAGTAAKKSPKISITPGAEKIKSSAPKKAAATSQKLPKELAEKAAQKSDKITDAGAILKRQRLISNAIKAGGAVVAVILLACLWLYLISPWMDERAYQQTLTNMQNATRLEEKIDILENYITQAPEGYAQKAKNVKQQVVQDMKNKAFDEAVQTVSKLPIDDSYKEKAEAVYNRFLKQYPDSPYTDQVNKMISRIPEVINDDAFRKLKAIPAQKLSKRLEACQDYLAKYPDSSNTETVKKMIDELGEKFYSHIVVVKEQCNRKNDWEQCIKLCDYFAENFSQHNRSDDVLHLKKTMVEKKDWHAVTQKIDEKEKYSEKAKGLYQDYLQKHPDSALQKMVENRLAHIEKLQNEKKEWENTLQYATNANISIFDRVNRVNAYMKSNPPDSYANKAKAILARLEKEKAVVSENLRLQKEQEEREQQRQQNIQEKRARVRSALNGMSGKFVEKTEGTVTDIQTGLTWCMLDSSVMTDACLDYARAKEYVENLSTGGYTDWRLPTPNELIIIYNNTPTFPAVEETDWYWTSEVFSAAWQKKVNTVKQTPAGKWQKSETNLNKCGTVRAVRP